MRSQNEKLSHLRFVEPTRWRAEIIAALKLKKGNIEASAERLNVHRATLHRWLAEDTELRSAKRKMMRELETT
jgi:ActR/RegA family two-component response regulator